MRAGSAGKPSGSVEPSRQRTASVSSNALKAPKPVDLSDTQRNVGHGIKAVLSVAPLFYFGMEPIRAKNPLAPIADVFGAAGAPWVFAPFNKCFGSVVRNIAAVDFTETYKQGGYTGVIPTYGVPFAIVAASGAGVMMITKTTGVFANELLNKYVFGLSGFAMQLGLEEGLTKRFCYPYKDPVLCDFDKLWKDGWLGKVTWLIKSAFYEFDEYVATLSLYEMLRQTVNSENSYANVAIPLIYLSVKFGIHCISETDPLGKDLFGSDELSDLEEQAKKQTGIDLAENGDYQLHLDPEQFELSGPTSSESKRQACKLGTKYVFLALGVSAVTAGCAVAKLWGFASDQQQDTKFNSDSVSLVQGVETYALLKLGEKSISMAWYAAKALVNRCSFWMKKQPVVEESGIMLGRGGLSTDQLPGAGAGAPTPSAVVLTLNAAAASRYNK